MPNFVQDIFHIPLLSDLHMNSCVSILYLQFFRVRDRPKRMSVVREEEGCLSSADIFRIMREGGSSDVDVCTFWCKNKGIFEVYVVAARTRGKGWLNQCGDILWTRGSIFRDFLRTSFMDGLLRQLSLRVTELDTLITPDKSVDFFLFLPRIL